MHGRSKIFGKKDRSPCLFKSKQLFFSLVSLASKETYYSLYVHALMTQQPCVVRMCNAIQGKDLKLYP